MTFVWLTPLIILVLFPTVILHQDSVQEKSFRSEENLRSKTIKSREAGAKKQES